MNHDEFEDLKQFMLQTVFQSEARLEERISAKIDSLRDEMLDGFTGVGEAIQEINDRLDKRDKEVDTRLIKLEQKIA